MFFTLSEIAVCLGISIFEVWINIISLIVFTFLLAFQVDAANNEEINWWKVFLPLFIADGLNCYFCVILSVRMYLSGQVRYAIYRINYCICVLTLVFVFKFLLCKELNGPSDLEYSEILSPIFILLQLFAARACHMH